MDVNEYDLVVIGSGPAGQKSAICAAKLRKKVAIIDRKKTIGGVCVHTGTIPSKTLREAVLYLSGFRQRSFYGRSYVLKDRIAMSDLVFRAQAVMAREIEVIKRSYAATRSQRLRATPASSIPTPSKSRPTKDRSFCAAHNIMIACGTRPAHSADIPIDGKRIFDSDEVHCLEEVPRDLLVVGAGIIGLEFASMFAALGVKVTLLDQRPTLLDFVDHEIVESLCFQLRQLGTVFRLGEKVVSGRLRRRTRPRLCHASKAERTSMGRAFSTPWAGRPTAISSTSKPPDCSSDGRGKMVVNENFQTSVDHIYAAGDVIGFPALASTSMEQGRLASCHMFGKPGKMIPNLIPYGIYTIPEISMVGHTEEQLTKEKIPYEVGLARYAELAKGQMLGDDQGLLKLLFDPDSLKLLGVHVIGDRAAEIVHIGQAAMLAWAALSNISATRFSTIRLWPKPTKSRRWTDSTNSDRL